MNKKKIAIVFGGRSVEHAVSVRSAQSVYTAIDKARYDVVLLGISIKGKWFHIQEYDFLPLQQVEATGRSFPLEQLKTYDLVFPLVHGTGGEDGTLQGVLELMEIPYIGASVLGSAVGMDKDVMKRLLKEAGIPVAKFLVYRKPSAVVFNKVVQALGLPFFVKPANAGSSVGVSKVQSAEEYHKAVDLAFQYDSKILCEEAVIGRELEVSVLGNEIPETSVAGEITPKKDFYSYEAKYLDAHGADLQIPAEIDEKMLGAIQNLAIRTYQTLECAGMARVDFFLKSDGSILVNEINTIPGFTSISMYPKLWEASGVRYTELLDRLIQLAFDRHETKQKLVRIINE